MSLTRRDVIKAGVFAGAALSLPLSRVVSGQSSLSNRMPASKLPKPFTTPFATPPVAVPFRTDATTDYYAMTMRATPLEVIPGFKTMFFAYEGSVPGPTIQANQGRKVVVRHINSLPKVHPTLGYEPWTSVHLHGSASLPEFDGYASDITRPGEYKNYTYPNVQPARTLWYHDHGVHHTAENAYHGLAAQYQMFDPLEQALPIPHGRYDVPLLISDAMFNNDGSLLFSLEDESGLWGDVILVNGRPWPVMQVERRKYRFRILGCAISRSWKFSLDSGEPMAVIATDGGLMPAPQFVRSFRAASSERYEVIIDFAKYPIGRRVILQNTSPTNNRNFTDTNKIMAFDVVSEATDLSNNSIPAVLNPSSDVMALQANQAVVTRKFKFERDGGNWAINGTTWEDVVDSDYKFTLAKPKRNDVEIWEFENNSGGWFHPVHVHFTDFKVLDRNGRPPAPHELGPKDVVYVGEGEKVRVLIQWKGVGRYMMHCHNLIHEDHDMMAQFELVDPNEAGHDPRGTHARPQTDLPGDPL
ncbi:MAG TPA: multicopper oxidase domain-containing protein [Ilumatobacteraceae bacterium]|nr:multicopper oxidase domain-containing protein [Ilumatobacteraceae bacterium]